MRVTRLFLLLDRLRGLRAPKTAEALARELEVSPRTVYRDIATLQSIGAPIEGQAGLGYRLRKGFFLPPLGFDPDELEALVLGARMVATRADPDLADAARRASAKIAHVVSREDADRLPLQAVGRARPERDAESRALRVVRHAIRGRQVLAVRYRDLQDRVTDRRVRPLGVTAFEQVWIVSAWCDTREDFRDVRLDRFVEVRPTGTRFVDEPGKRWSDYLARVRDST